MKKQKTGTAKVIALTRRKKVDGSIPIYLMIRFNGQKKPVSLKFSVNENEFNFENNRYKKYKAGNIKINAIEEKAYNINKELGKNFSFHAFEEKFFGANVKSFTVADYLDKIKQDNYDKGNRSNGDFYKGTRSMLINFKGKNLKFTDITISFLEKFEIHLKKTNGTSSISMYMRTLRSAFNSAIDDKIISIDLYPFSNSNGKGHGKKGYSIKNKKTKSKFSLPKEDMLSIINYPTKPKTRLRDSINYFAFSYLCRGMNFKDMCYLTWNDIKNDRITYIRRKTEETNTEEKEISIKLTDKLAFIVEQYSNNDPYIFPVLEPNLSGLTAKYRMHGRLKKINQDLRQVGEELNINRWQELIFYVARHTYANILNENKVNLSDISESLGHSSIKTTENYIHSLNERLDKNDEFLT